ncbi:hypothetical protein [Salipiger mangrovisoli]|uniref:Uncharacterized protein n=1 Tax=Salipiger mangrovisoli TaxID=2865933 RepID=A0ABR9WVD6_9RHOB|nr:hypothetical protein [Salipiger mangrovisoli]MBE9635246.1 hypothetical protein [Salipiger mangrovisoli]
MRLLLLTALALTGACTDFPEFDGSQAPGVATAPWPKLLPLDGVLRAEAPPRTQPEMAGELDARAEALRRRAAALQGDVVEGTARARMDGGVRFPEVPDA